MQLILFFSGLAIFLALLTDLFYTSFSLRGAGFISAPTTKAVWNALVSFSSQRNRRLLNNAGLIIICQTESISIHCSTEWLDRVYRGTHVSVLVLSKVNSKREFC